MSATPHLMGLWCADVVLRYWSAPKYGLVPLGLFPSLVSGMQRVDSSLLGLAAVGFAVENWFKPSTAAPKERGRRASGCPKIGGPVRSALNLTHGRTCRKPLLGSSAVTLNK